MDEEQTPKELEWHDIDWGTAEFEWAGVDTFILSVDFKDGTPLTEEQLESMSSDMVAEAAWERWH